jgi:hypothetical protein
VADRIRSTTPLAWLLALTAALVLLGLLGSDAAAKTRVFKPVHKAGKAVVFKPRGLTPQTVKRASVKLHRKGRVVKRRLRIRKVRGALSKNKPIRVKTKRPVRVAKLIVQYRGAGSCLFGTFSSRNVPGACWRPFSDSSPFNQAVPASATLAANSAAIVSRLTSWGTPGKHASGDAGTAGDWSHPIYYSQPGDPVYTAHCTEPWGTCDMEGMQIRIPAAAQPAAGSDGHLAVIDQQSGWEYDFYGVKQKGNGVIVSAWGGRIRIDGDGRGGGSTAADFPLAAGVIRPAELAAGSIRHALVISVQCTNGTSVYPAGPGAGRECSEMGLPSENAPAMGQHFFLDMSEAQIGALGVPNWQKTILRAMAEYGMYVEDTGGSSWGVMFESGASVTSFGFQDPWERLGQQFNLPAWEDTGIDKRRFIYDFRNAVNWASALKVAAP